MIALYVWTDTQIINAINIKEHFFYEKKVDLFVCLFNRITMPMIEEIKQAGIFNTVYLITPMSSEIQKMMVCKTCCFNSLIVIIQRKRYYSRLYREIIGKRKYQRVFTAGYWGDSLYFIRYLYKNNKNLQVEFIEEGSMSYCASLERMCEAKHLGCVIRRIDYWKSKVIKGIILDRLYFKANSLVESIYLYRPSLAKINIKKNVMSQVDNNGILYQKVFLKMCNSISFEKMKNSRIIFFSLPILDGYENDHLITNRIIETLRDVFFDNEIMIKPHPNMLEGYNTLVSQVTENVYIDTQFYPFEILAALVDVSEKILIARNTSCLLSVKYMLDQEPIIIYTFKLYEEYEEGGEPDLEWCVKGLKSTYRNPQKILIPRTIDELKRFLVESL